MLLWLWLSVPASAGELSDLAGSEGFVAVAERIEAIAAAEKSDKKRAKALDRAGLGALQIPAKAAGGAELSVPSVSPLQGCAWASGGVRCAVEAAGGAGAPEDYRLQCATPRGGRLDLEARGESGDGGMRWTVDGVERCLALGEVTVRLLPKAHEELDVIGMGSEDAPPELVALKWDQVEALLKEQHSAFAYCASRRDAALSGQVDVAFTLDAKGGVETATIEKSTLDNAEVEQCILQRFERVQFPPPMGGVAKGTYPIRIFQ